MTSLRHNVVEKEPRDAYLDAARDCILDVGWRRTTLTEDGPAIARITEGIVGTVRQLRHNELFVRIVELDPELILPYLFSRRGRSQELILSLTADAIAKGQKAREIRKGNP